MAAANARRKTAGKPGFGAGPMCMAHGGIIEGPGTETSDSIPAEAEPGTYIQPADTTKVMVSNGESAFSPRDQQALGAVVMETMRQLTHKPAGRGARAPRVAVGTPAAPLFADGGMVDDEQRAAPVPTPAPTPAPVSGPAASDAFMPTTRAVLSGSGEDAAASLKAGDYAGAAGNVVRGTAALLPAVAQDVVAPALQLGVSAGRRFGSALLGQTDATAGTQQPGAAGARPSYGAGLAAGAGGGRGSVNPPPVGAIERPDLASVPLLSGGATGDAGVSVAGAPGVRRLTSEDGRTLYSNVPGAADNNALMSGKPGVQMVPGFGAGDPRGGTGSAVPTGASAGPLSDALASAREAAIARGDLKAVSDSYGGNFAGGAYAGQPTGPTSYIPGVNAPNSQYETERLARNASVVGTAGLGAISGREAARLANARQIAADSNATSLQGAQISAGAHRYATDTQAATAASQFGVTAPEHQAKAQLAASMYAARAGYAKALQSGDPKAIANAEATLRGFEGKYEKPVSDYFSTTALPAAVGSDGTHVPGGAIVTDRRTGDTRIIPATDLQAKQAMPLGIYVGASAPAKYKDGQYDLNGKKVTIQGGKIARVE